MSFKGTAQAYLLKILIKHNKKQIPLANLLNNCISAKSAPHMLSMQDECTFCFSNVLIIGLCNYLFSETMSDLICVPFLY